MWMRFLQVVVILAMTTQAAFAGGPMGSIQVGPWNGGAFIGDKTGAVSCGATAAE
jgi:hypothetical protein